ncbi:TMAO reductase system periplasmic protein TorT [Defluviimonas sp. SAOS-178_SWC]|uniref:TMAO reductase system periplasmic protein TorT n=1 Tax=Defluviimonas sp. SAOS-178_SWC TaxID=3121287 RepID=UPI0032217DBC
MAVMIWISRLSNPVARMMPTYRAFFHAAILAVGMGSGFSAAADAGGEPEVCVLVPHFKDEYWLSVAYGVSTEAETLGLSPRFLEAGGYRAVRRQTEQIAACTASGAAAMVIGVVSSDDPELLQAISDAARVIPVVGFVNESRSTALAGFVGVDWRVMGSRIGDYLARRHPKGQPPVTAVLITGPEQAGWTAPLETGLRRSLENSAVRLAAVYHADTSVREQLGEVEVALSQFADADYLIGSAPAIEAAMGLAATGAVADMPALVATYVSHSVLRGLTSGKVRALAFDDPIAQGRLAMQRVDDVLAGRLGEEGEALTIELLTGPFDTPQNFRLSPPEYFPASE